MYDPIEVSQAASKAREELEKSGAVGRTETIQKTILAETTVTVDNYTTQFGVNGCFMLPGVIPFEPNKKYRVSVDGDVLAYDTAWLDKYPEDEQARAIHTIGNAALYSDLYPNTGEPWLVISALGMGMAAVGFADPAENEKSHTVAVYELVETIHPIDPKYLPGVCLPVVEITSAPYSFGAGNTVPLTVEESAQFNAAVTASDFVLIKIRLDGDVDLYDTFVACCLRVEGVTVLSHSLTADLRIVFVGPDPETGLWAMGG